MRMRRTTFIIKPNLQIKYLIFTVISVVLICVFVYLTLWTSIANSSVYKQSVAGDQYSLKMISLKNFGLVLVLLVMAASVESIYLFHRIFGPIYAFERVIKMVQDGNFTAQLHLRKTDDLRDMANEIQNMCSNLRETINNEKEKINSIQSQLDETINSSDPPLIRTKLTEIKRTLGTVLQKFRV